MKTRSKPVFLIALVLAVIIAVSGCASARQQSIFAFCRSSDTASDRATIVLNYSQNPSRIDNPFSLYLNGQLVLTTKGAEPASIQVEPGTYDLRIKVGVTNLYHRTAHLFRGSSLYIDPPRNNFHLIVGDTPPPRSKLSSPKSEVTPLK